MLPGPSNRSEEKLIYVRQKCEAASSKARATVGFMKLCTNSNCQSYGRVVYTTATRCIFCRCDLKPTWTRSGITPAQKTRPEAVKKTA